MPPLNHRMSDVEKSGTVYTVSVTVQNTGPDGESTFDKETHFLESFEGAMRVAINEVGDQPTVRKAGGMMAVYEPHDEGETYRQAVIRERRVFAHR